jgi:hypothetical protein
MVKVSARAAMLLIYIYANQELKSGMKNQQLAGVKDTIP